MNSQEPTYNQIQKMFERLKQLNNILQNCSIMENLDSVLEAQTEALEILEKLVIEKFK